MRPPAPGDEITTVAWRGGNTLCVPDTVHSVTTDGRMFFAGSVHTCALQGVTWIYGRHTAESEEGQALLAAYALTREV